MRQGDKGTGVEAELDGVMRSDTGDTLATLTELSKYRSTGILTTRHQTCLCSCDLR